MSKPPIKFFSGTTSRDFAEKVAKHYGQDLGKVAITKFSDGEIQPCYEETVRGDYVVLIQSTHQPIQNLFELLLLIDAARRASAHTIVAVIPYFGYARQDRKDRPRVSIASKLIANLITAAGVDRIITMDLHADQIQGFFDVPVDHLYSSKVFHNYIKGLNLDNLVIASPDTGGSKRANAYSKGLGLDLVICHKTRAKANVVSDMTVIGNVKGKNVILIDDMIDTAGTITMAAKVIKDQGAESVRVIATHALLSGPAYERIENSPIEELVVTDSIPIQQESPKIKVISVSKLFAEVIRRVFVNESISGQYVY